MKLARPRLFLCASSNECLVSAKLQLMKTIEYFYSAHSAYAYIGTATLYELCERHGCRLQHKPFTLSPVVEASGAVPFKDRTDAHEDYYFGREIQRWAEYRGVPIMQRRPTHHDNSLDLVNGLLVAAIGSGLDIDALSATVLREHWVSDIDLNDRGCLVSVLGSLGIEPEPLLSEALSEKYQTAHQQNTQEAIQRNLFGSPTYVFDDEVFYGQDRLELLEHALIQPFSKTVFINRP